MAHEKVELTDSVEVEEVGYGTFVYTIGLNFTPSPEWIELFNAPKISWSYPPHYREFSFHHKYVSFRCAESKFVNYKNGLKDYINQANERYEESGEKRLRGDKATKEREKAAAEKAKDLLKKS